VDAKVQNMSTITNEVLILLVDETINKID